MSGHIDGLDVARVREDFPILSRTVGDKPLVYLDSAATSQKPRQVIEAVVDFYSSHNANAHRGIYALGEEATELFEGARAKVARFFGAPSPSTIVFTSSRDGSDFGSLVTDSGGAGFIAKAELTGEALRELVA